MTRDRSSTGTITLYPYGDEELWYAAGQDEDGNAWSLPLRVRWGLDKENDRHFALIEPAVSFYTSQHLVMNALFEPHDFRGRKDSWLILKSSVEALLRKAQGITPRYYYQWPDAGMPAIPLAKPMRITENANGNNATLPMVRQSAPFIRYVAEESGMPSSVISAVISAVAKYAPRWMLEERQPIDIGFCRLLAVPFRVNWKEIVTFKVAHWKLLRAFARPGKEVDEALEEIGLPQALASTDNVSLRRKPAAEDMTKWCDYTLEATPLFPFQAACDSVEGKRAACGKTGYVAHYETTVEKLYHHLVAALRTYVKKINTPFARISESSETGELRFVCANETKVRGTGLRRIPPHIVAPPRPFSVLAEQSAPFSLRAPVDEVPQVPTVLPAVEDVRQCEKRGDVECIVGRIDGPGVIGVPLLDASEGVDAGEPVFSGAEAGARDASGMDEKGD